MSFTHIIFRTLYALVSRPSCSTGKATDRHRKTPYRAAQRFSAWVHASEKSRSLYFSCCLSGQMHGIWFRSAEQGAEFRSCPLRGCRFALLPFALPHFRESSSSTCVASALSGFAYPNTSASPAEPPCISSGFFPKEQAERLKNEQNSFAGFHHAQSKPLKNGRVRPCGICSKDTADQIEDTARTL